MWRRPSSISTRIPPWSFSALAILAALAISSVRIPAPNNLDAPSSAERLVVNQEDTASLKYVSPQRDLVVIVRPSNLMSSSLLRNVNRENGQIRQFVDQMTDEFQQMAGIELEDIDQVTFCQTVPLARLEEETSSFIVIQTRKPNMENFKKLGDTIVEDADGIFIMRNNGPVAAGFEHGFIVDDKTIIWASSEKEIEHVLDLKSKDVDDAEWFDSFESVSRRPLIFLAQNENLQRMLRDLLPALTLSEEQVESLAVAKGLVFGGDCDRNVDLSLALSFETRSEAKAAETTGKELIKIGKTTANSYSMVARELEKPILKMALNGLKKTKLDVSGKTLTFKSSFTPDFRAINAFTDTTSAAAVRTDSANRIRQLVIGMHNYHDSHGHFPPAVLISDSGKEYSWRVAILPYVELIDMYDEYRFDEDWDSEHNLGVTALVPEFFRHPDEKGTNCSYFAIVGDQTCFPGGTGIDLEDVTDGTSRTIALVEAKSDIHWAKPQDISIVDALVRSNLGGFNEKGFNAAYADGSVHFIENTIDLKELKALLTATGGEVIDN